MGIDLNKKQIFRTLSDMVVYHPSDAKDIFKIILEHKNSNQFSEIYPLMNFISDFPNNYSEPSYLKKLRYEIENISNEEIRIIFLNSLNNKLNDKIDG